MADLIDRQALYKKASEFEASALRRMVEELMQTDDLDDIKECARWSVIWGVCKPLTHAVADVPSVKPERKKGKWTLKPNIYGVAYCSECGYELHTNNTNYCPNCGARMEGGDAEKAD